jgi:hypothetical protein
VGCPALLHTQKFLFAVVTHRNKKNSKNSEKSPDGLASTKKDMAS